jgi:hypothetical protein
MEGAGTVAVEPVDVKVVGLGTVWHVVNKEARSQMQQGRRGIVMVEGVAREDDVTVARYVTTRWWRGLAAMGGAEVWGLGDGG